MDPTPQRPARFRITKLEMRIAPAAAGLIPAAHPGDADTAAPSKGTEIGAAADSTGEVEPPVAEGP